MAFGFDRVGARKKGKKKKRKTNRKEKGKMNRKQNSFGSQQEWMKQQIPYNLLAPFTRLFLTVPKRLYHAAIHRLLVENAQDSSVAATMLWCHPLCALARINMWPRWEITGIRKTTGKDRLLQAPRPTAQRNNKQSISLQPAGRVQEPTVAGFR